MSRPMEYDRGKECGRDLNESRYPDAFDDHAPSRALNTNEERTSHSSCG